MLHDGVAGRGEAMFMGLGASSIEEGLGIEVILVISIEGDPTVHKASLRKPDLESETSRRHSGNEGYLTKLPMEI